MRASCYLNTIDIGDGNSLLYNGFSMCMDVVPSEIAGRLAASAEGGDLLFLTPAEKERLAERGHLTGLSVRGEQEEMRKLVYAIAERDTGPDGQPFTQRMVSFILTYKCNLSCAYCYQNPIREASASSLMSEGFVDDFFRDYLHKLIPGVAGSGLRLILFGGEPLLPSNRRTIERTLHYAKEYGSIVSTTTNALTLPQMLDLVGPEPGKIRNVQVTLDGARTLHDRMRVPRSGTPTFDTMIRSLHALVGAKAHAIVRVHLHPDGLGPARELVEYLDKEKILGHDNVEVYFAPLHSFHTKDISSPDLDSFSEIFQYVALKQKLPPIQNFDFLQDVMNVKTARNWRQPRYCAVGAGLHYAVDPRGDVYECLEEAGNRERRTGTLRAGEIEYTGLRDVYRKRYLANMPDCLKCSIALFCGGGCISRTRTRGGASSRQFCNQNKIFVGQTLKACFLLKQGRERASGNGSTC
jgi:uncharacterized protein